MKTTFWIIAASSMMLLSCTKGSYLDPGMPVEQRVKNLMARMTIDDEIGQMEQCAVNWDSATILKNRLYEGAGFGAWIGETTPREYNRMQRLSEQSRLKIPYLFGCDAPHGHAIMKGRTVFPTSISMAATWNPDLVERCARAAAREIRATGIHWTYSPCIDIVQDARWGRTGETYGECPFLTSAMAVANVKGLQGNLGPDNVIACPKHLYGGGASIGGVNHGNAEISERTARSIFLRPFKAAVDAGCLTIMPGHNDVNGIPNHANHWLLTDLVKKEWGWKGFYITDMGDIENLLTSHIHRLASTQKEAVRLGIDAGLDMHMYSDNYQQFRGNLRELYDEKKISKARIDDACSRILRVKFQLGLFENRYIKDPEANSHAYGSEEALSLALDAARQNIVMLTNADSILPLDTKRYHRILVTGPNANNQSVDGDWSNPQPENHIITILRGLRTELKDAEISYVDCGRMKGKKSNLTVNTTDPATQSRYLKEGGEINDQSIDSVVSAARRSDLAVFAIGGYGLRYDWGLRTYGESADRPSIDFYGRQVEMMQKAAATGVPFIVVIIGGKPLNNAWVTAHAKAMLYAWEPGMYGGQAVGEILAGKVNPSGHLPITIPRDAGQIPMYYYQTKSRFTTGYYIGGVRGDNFPAFAFGHGLSYTSFRLTDTHPADTLITRDHSYRLMTRVENTGQRAGYATVMAFVGDEQSSVVTPLRMLCGFQKVWLEAGASRDITIDVPFESFMLWNLDMKHVAEPGYFQMEVGFASDKISYKKRLKL